MAKPSTRASSQVISKAWSCSELAAGNDRLLKSKLEETAGDDRNELKETIKMRMKAGSCHVLKPRQCSCSQRLWLETGLVNPDSNQTLCLEPPSYPRRCRRNLRNWTCANRMVPLRLLLPVRRVTVEARIVRNLRLPYACMGTCSTLFQGASPSPMSMASAETCPAPWVASIFGGVC